MDQEFGSEAMGAGQFMKNTLDAPGTLRDIEGEMGLTGREKAAPDLQDRMAYHLLKRRGYNAFVAGEISVTGFGKLLAMEWASFPVLADTKGRHRTVKRGQSYYAGDGLNKALVTPETADGWLDQVYVVANAPAVPAEAPVEEYEHDIALAPKRPQAPSWLAIAIIAVLAVLVGAGVFFGQAATTGAEVSLLGDAPIPRDRPLRLFGGGDGGNLWADIGMQIDLSFVAPLVSAAPTALVGWIGWQWQRVLKADFDAKSAEALHKALERDMLAAIDAVGSRATKDKKLAFAANYAATNNPGAVRHFKLGLGDLEELAVPHLVSATRK